MFACLATLIIFVLPVLAQWDYDSDANGTCNDREIALCCKDLKDVRGVYFVPSTYPLLICVLQWVRLYGESQRGVMVKFLQKDGTITQSMIFFLLPLLMTNKQNVQVVQ